MYTPGVFPGAIFAGGSNELVRRRKSEAERDSRYRTWTTRLRRERSRQSAGLLLAQRLL